jgi:protein-disulfide isomerase
LEKSQIKIPTFNKLFIFLILFLSINCNSSNSEVPTIPQEIPSAIEIKNLLMEDSIRNSLENKAKSLGYANLKEWKMDMIKIVSESEMDILYSREKNSNQYSNFFLQESNPKSVRDELANRIAWTRIMNESKIEYSSKMSQSSKQIKASRKDLLNKLSFSSPSRGSQKANLVVYEFTDYTCQFCKKSQSVSKKIQLKYKDRIKWKFVDYPLTDPPFSDSTAHIFGNCIFQSEPNQFWDYFDLAFLSNGLSQPENVKSIALNQFQWSPNKWNDCINNNGQFAGSIERLIENKNIADQLGISATPSFLIGNKLVQGYLPFEKFEKILLQEINSF